MRRQGWAEFHDWRIERDAATPLFRQVYLQLRGAILAQRLKPGGKLPSTRDLARELGLARASIVAAYEQLLAEGFVTGRTGAGTFVAADLPEPVEGARQRAATRAHKASSTRTTPTPGGYYDATVQGDARPFNTGRALLDARTVEVWRRLTQQSLRSFDPIHLGYSDPRGLPELREQIADYLRAARAVRCEPDQIVVTAGTQHAIDLAIRVLLKRGDEAWVEDPGYPPTFHALVEAGVAVKPIRVDAHGLDVASGIRKAPRARLAFITPSHQYPLGVVLSMARRVELLAWAREAGAWILEDDYQSEFRYSGGPLASLQGLDEAERVIYCGTFNKALFPGLRMGYLVVPHGLLPEFIRARYLLDRQPPSLFQVVMTQFLREGHLAGHIRRMRALYREQRDALVATLTRHAGGHLEMTAPDQGMHLVAHLASGLVDHAIEAAARAAGINVRAVSRLYRAATPRPGLLLGFSGYPRQVIVPAATSLARVIGTAARA
jgi:GntR family transcriptional regulator/MocR family aminotransferase